MKTLVFFAMWGYLLLACNPEIKPQISELDISKIISRGNTFEHQITNCTIDPTFENTCTDWIMFREENKVEYLIGGGDIVFRGDIVVINDSIKIHNENTGNEVLKFLPLHADTLLETNSGEKWVKGRFYDLE